MGRRLICDWHKVWRKRINCVSTHFSSWTNKRTSTRQKISLKTEKSRNPFIAWELNRSFHSLDPLSRLPFYYWTTNCCFFQAWIAQDDDRKQFHIWKWKERKRKHFPQDQNVRRELFGWARELVSYSEDAQAKDFWVRKECNLPLKSLNKLQNFPLSNFSKLAYTHSTNSCPATVPINHRII